MIEIHPAWRDGRFDDQLRCTLVARPLDGIPVDIRVPWRYGHPADSPSWFEALSYTWGSWEDCRWILLNGHRFTVTQNLWDALRRLKRFYAIRRLWVDQVCINQRDNDERSKQVRLMGKIFSSASQVLVWLGESALPFAERSSAMYYNPADQLARALDNTSPVWWTRAWVVQERLSARWIEVVFGPISLTWDRVRALCILHSTVHASFWKLLCRHRSS